MSTIDKPRRIQRKRTKGWRMLANTVYVGRGTRWGNPFKIASSKEAVSRFEQYMKLYIDSLRSQPNGKEELEAYLGPLRGKNLACWCKPGAPCHADVLLKLANDLEVKP